MLEASCSTCGFWNQGAPENAAATRAIPEDPSIGTCERFPPSIVEGGFYHGTFFPRTHASRCCGDWEPDYVVGGPDGGEEVPAPDSTVVPFGRRSA